MTAITAPIAPHPKERPVKRQRKRIETSKLVLKSVIIMSEIATVALFVGWFMGLDGAWSMLAVVKGTEASVIGFYIWKAKTENVLKYAKTIDRDISDTDAQKSVLDTMAKEQINTDSGSSYSPYY